MIVKRSRPRKLVQETWDRKWHQAIMLHLLPKERLKQFLTSHPCLPALARPKTNLRFFFS